VRLFLAFMSRHRTGVAPLAVLSGVLLAAEVAFAAAAVLAAWPLAGLSLASVSAFLLLVLSLPAPAVLPAGCCFAGRGCVVSSSSSSSSPASAAAASASSV